MGLTIKIGLSFLLALGVFIVIFGNLVTPPAQPTPSKENSISTQNLPQTTEVLEPILKEARHINLEIDEGLNVTKSLAAFIGKSIVEQNPQGPKENKIHIKEVETVAFTAINELLKDFDPTYFKPVITRDEIIISKTQTEAAYRNKLALILSTLTSQPPSTDAALLDQINEIRDRHKEAAVALLATPTPQSLIDEHLSTLTALKSKERIFEAMADYETDPLRAFLAMRLLKPKP